MNMESHNHHNSQEQSEKVITKLEPEPANLILTPNISGIVILNEKEELKEQQQQKDKDKDKVSDNVSIVSITESSSSTSGSSSVSSDLTIRNSSSTNSLQLSLDGTSKDKSKSKSKWKKSKVWRYRGFIYTLFSSLFFSLTALVVKYLKDYHPINLALWRYQGAFLPSIPFVIMYQLAESRKHSEKCAKSQNVEAQTTDNNTKLSNQIIGQEKQIMSQPPPVQKKKRKVRIIWSQWKVVIVTLLRSILTCNALILHFYSLKYLGLGDALVISSSTPIFAFCFAHYFLGESCGVMPILTSFATLFGVIVITRPMKLFATDHYDYQTMVGVSLALGCTLLSTASFIVLRYMRRIHYSTTLCAFGSWGTFENLVLAFAMGIFGLPQGQDWYLAGALSVLTFFGQIAIILALKSEQTGPVSLVRTCDVIFGYFFQTLLDHKLPDIYSLVGAAIVITCLCFTAVRKWLAHLPDDHSTKIKFWFLLT